MKSFVISFSFLFAMAFAQAAQASCGTFEVSKGNVSVKAASGGASSKATVGSKVCAGDTVVAAADSRAKIKMEDGNELNISPASEIIFEQYVYDTAQNKKKVLLNILKGKVRATTREEHMYNDKAKDGQANTFQVKTKSAVAGVRGTDFLTSYDSKTQKTEIVTFRGQVEVGTPGANGKIVGGVQVNVGQKTSVDAGKAPETPRAVPAAEMNKVNVETKNESAANSGGGSGSTSASADAKSGDAKSADSKSGDGKSADGRADGKSTDSKSGDTKSGDAKSADPKSDGKSGSANSTAAAGGTTASAGGTTASAGGTTASAGGPTAAGGTTGSANDSSGSSTGSANTPNAGSANSSNSGPSGSSNATTGPTATSGVPSANREPASASTNVVPSMTTGTMPSGSMLSNDDLAKGAKAPVMSLPTMSMPNIPNIVVPTLPQSVKDKLESKTSNVNVVIKCPTCGG